MGCEPGTILPSRAFCSDENQGYPIILITKHFGTFPFNLGRGGAVVATDRHGPYTEHGEALVIIQASHVGYDPDSNAFGIYNRIHTSNNRQTACCGKLATVTDWYLEKYRIARTDVLLERCNDQLCLRIDNGLLRGTRQEGLFLNMTLSREKTPIFNFIAERIHWSPRSKSDLVTQTGPALLGSAGFDLGLLDGLQTRNKKRLDKNDTETF